MNPNGLLAAGGNLRPDTLIDAYNKGIFPWYSEGEPLLWWSPDPRAVIFPSSFHRSRSLSRLWRKGVYRITFNQAFHRVIQACSQPRGDSAETWITADMQAAYLELHRLGHAHSVEVWSESTLVGGIYGVSVGAVFCGESMFSEVSNASKLALVGLTQMTRGLELIDCQLPNPHLFRLGAERIPRSRFLQLLEQYRGRQLAFPNG